MPDKNLSLIRIAYVTTELEPLLVISTVSNLVKNLAMYMQDQGADIRIFMPKYGIFSDRKNKIHQVNRLSGLNIIIGKMVCELIVKSTSLQDVKLQLYFIDGEMFFEKQIFHNEDGSFLKNNDVRSIFFCRGILETLYRLGWCPNIIHCHDWFSIFLPILLTYVYKDLKQFADTKTIVSLYNGLSDVSFDGSLLSKFCLVNNSKELPDVFFKDSYGIFDLIEIGIKNSNFSVFNTEKAYSFPSKITFDEYFSTFDNEIIFAHYYKIYKNLLKE